MPVIAIQRLKVGHDEKTDTPIYRNVDEEVPEAEGWSWQTLAHYERNGRIRVVPDAPKQAEAAPAVATKPHPMSKEAREARAQVKGATT